MNFWLRKWFKTELKPASPKSVVTTSNLLLRRRRDKTINSNSIVERHSNKFSRDYSFSHRGLLFSLLHKFHFLLRFSTEFVRFINEKKKLVFIVINRNETGSSLILLLSCIILIRFEIMKLDDLNFFRNFFRSRFGDSELEILFQQLKRTFLSQKGFAVTELSLSILIWRVSM